MKTIRKTEWKVDYILIGIMLIATCTRLIGLSNLPDGIIPDEAYGAYNAYSIMNEGIDSRGYQYPVYFVAWGSGMSVLNSYLAIPFMKLFGATMGVYRIPQALISIASVYAIYQLGKDLFEKKAGYLFAFVLAINPWNIMNARIGLDCNLAPGMFLVALCFLVKGLQKNEKYLLISAFAWGLVLYCYALTWLVVPLLFVGIFLLYYKRIPKSRYSLLFILIIFVMALPLILFVLINMGILPEIRTSFMSIPKLPGFRGSELSISNVWNSIKELTKMIIHQYDGSPHISSETVGSYYLFTTPFILIGLIYHVVKFAKEYQNGDNKLEYVFLLWTVCAFVQSILNQNINFTRTNLIHVTMIFYGAYGIWRVAEVLKNRWLIPVCVVFICLSFVYFYFDYATTDMTYFADERMDEVIEAAKDAAGDGTVTIIKCETIKYSLLLWHEKPDASHYYQNVVYMGHPGWAELEQYGQFRYTNDIENVTEKGVYIIPTQPIGYELDLRQRGFAIQPVNDRFSLAINK